MKIAFANKEYRKNCRSISVWLLYVINTPDGS
jgi:hypothetical protein